MKISRLYGSKTSKNKIFLVFVTHTLSLNDMKHTVQRSHR